MTSGNIAYGCGIFWRQASTSRSWGDAGTGTEALKLVARLKPDIVITDLYMPDGDGLSVARSVQRQRPGTKVVLVSAHAGRGYERLATEDEALAFIPKSEFTLEALRQVLEEEA